MKISYGALWISSLFTLKVNALAPFSWSSLTHSKINSNRNGFHLKLLKRDQISRSSSYSTSQLFESVCSIPQDVAVTDLSIQRGSAKILRTAVVTNVLGDYVPLDRPMGKGTSIVVFLRHMG